MADEIRLAYLDEIRLAYLDEIRLAYFDEIRLAYQASRISWHHGIKETSPPGRCG
jgi:hypothetical protein